MRTRSGSVPAARITTIRDSIHRVLLDGPASARDLSKLVGISEREVGDHLQHLERSLRHKGETLLIAPPICVDCGFEFNQRHRYTRPGRCPKCRGRRISLPLFRVAR
jgi:predicted Zn-ribbon and HTH transcriptional regulator